jgi:phospholipid/cholesterol/gamma-HCH transport system ATP-binding protein
MSVVRSKFGVLFQGAALFDSLTVFENVAFTLLRYSKLSRSEIEDRVYQKLLLVGLKDVMNLKPAELSGGGTNAITITVD